MPAVSYRLYLDGRGATRDQLDQIEEITVEQEVDMAWEARLQIPIRTDDNGRWSLESGDFTHDFSRVRVEIKVGNSGFTPLIDGPIIGTDSEMSSEPGQSQVTVLVQDDSVFLNRTEQQRRFDGKLDHEIAEALFRNATQIATTDIQTTPPPNDSLPARFSQRGTEMDVLRRIARRQGMHAYVLPGSEPGASVGVFRPFPTRGDGLPALVLLGPDRNLASFTARLDAQRAGRFESQALDISDKTVQRASASIRNLELLGAAADADDEEDSSRIVPPGRDGAVDVTQAANAALEGQSYGFEASGSVLGDCYGGVLAPYRVVSVRGINGRQSGDYLIRSVTHRLTRSIYEQSFGLARNARSEGTDGDTLGALAAGIF